MNPAQLSIAEKEMIAVINERDSLRDALQNCRTLSGAKFAEQFDRIHELETKLRSQREARQCGWWRQETPDGDVYYETGCKRAQQFSAGNWRDNSYHFCPYCGGQIIEVSAEPAIDPPGDYCVADHPEHTHVWVDIPPRRGEPNLRVCGCGVEERTPRQCPRCGEEIPAGGIHYCATRATP